MAHHAHVFDPTFIGAPVRSRPRRQQLSEIGQATFWLAIIGWWVALILGIIFAK